MRLSEVALLAWVGMLLGTAAAATAAASEVQGAGKSNGHQNYMSSNPNPAHLKFLQRRAGFTSSRSEAESKLNSRSLSSHHFDSYTSEEWKNAAKKMESIQHTLEIESSTRAYEGPDNLADLTDFTGTEAKKEHFVSECTQYLLSSDITSNNKISQVDSTHFLIYYSILVGICPGRSTDPCTKVIFEAIPVPMQLAFVWALCPFDIISGEDEICLSGLDAQGEEFGWLITGTDENWNYVSAEVANYCEALWRVDGSATFHGGTHAPTMSLKPSANPTDKPSSSPSDLPTESPTVSPTSAPSPSPSKQPTSSPSVSPTSTPTVVPSVHPTPSPSAKPSASPTPQPTDQPTLSKSPTVEPSHRPTFVGSYKPSVSKEPTAAPTSSPTHSPTGTPTASPSQGPTGQPTSSPTSSPTSNPSRGPTMTPTSSPTTLPTHSPSDVPTMIPTASPTLVASSAPSMTHSGVPTVPPSNVPSTTPTWISSAPSISLEPSSSPTYRDPFGVSFTYMLGFDNETISAQTLDDARLYVDIMDEVRQGIRRVLALNDVGRRRGLSDISSTAEKQDEYLDRMLDVVLLTDDPLGSIFHRNLKDDECPEEFTSSSSCVRVVTEVLVFANPETYTETQVSNSVWKPMRSSMSSESNDKFLSEVNGNGRGPGGEVKEAKYLADGPNVPLTPSSPDPQDDRLIGAPGIAGIAVGSIFLVGFLLVFGYGRSRMDDDRITREANGAEVSLSESDYSEDLRGGSRGSSSFLDLEIGVKNRGGNMSPELQQRLVPPPSLEESSTFEAEDVSKAAQFDIDTGNVIAPILSRSRSGSGSEHGSSSGSGSSSSGNSSSVLSDSQGSTDADAEALIGRLDNAVSNGDWAAVAAIAGDLSTADEASTYSSVPSRYSSHGSKVREKLSYEDKERAETIDRLVSIGDWNAVGATAAAFDSDSSMSGTERSNMVGLDQANGSESFGSGGNQGEQKKSILDFIAGPWQSKAASKVMAQDADSSGNEEKQMEVDDGISTLSGGFSPARNKAIDVEYAMTTGATAPPNSNNFKTDFSISESSTTEDDRKALLPPMTAQKKKRGWKGRLPFLGGKSSPDKEEGASRSLALQEDSSASSWSHGSSPMDSFTPYVNTNRNTSIETKKSGDEVSGDEEDTDVNMPLEMKAFGEDHGLAAADFAMQLEENSTASSREADDENSFSPRSKGSSSIASLQNDLDRAIESGDWAAVEAQTNKMFNMSLEVENINTGSARNELIESADNGTSFEDSSFVDGDSRDGWSTGSKSHTTTDSEQIDDERIAMLEKLIETDDWQGIVTASRLHNGEDSSMATSTEAGDDGMSFATEEGDKDKKMAAPALVSEADQDVQMEEEAEGSDDAMLESLPSWPDTKAKGS